MLGIIGGSGLCDYPGLDIIEKRPLETPYGEPSAALLMGVLNGQQVAFLPRHGEHHTIAPHKVNYRANIWALKHIGVTQILAVAAVGGMTKQYAPGVLAAVDQIIDYTYGREHSFYSDDFSADKHLDFTYPYDASLRQQLLQAAQSLKLKMVDGGTYAAVQGPRLETAAEIQRMIKDGCDVVGMTGMPEAYLARELGLPYATLAVVANWAAGLNQNEITMEQIHQTLLQGMEHVKAVIAELLSSR